MASLINHQVFDLSLHSDPNQGTGESSEMRGFINANHLVHLNELKGSWKSSVLEEVSLNEFDYVLGVPPGVFPCKPEAGV